MKKMGDIYILLTHETMWNKPIQATSFGKDREGKIYKRHFFCSWNTFEEAIGVLKERHNCEIKIDRQTKIFFCKNSVGR